MSHAPNLAGSTSKWSKRYFVDLMERVLATFLGALLAYLYTDSVLEKPDLDVLWPILVLPTLVSLIKGLLANMVDSDSGASMVPAPGGPVVFDDEGRVDGQV
jgi:hypothetical protein